MRRHSVTAPFPAPRPAQCCGVAPAPAAAPAPGPTCAPVCPFARGIDPKRLARSVPSTVLVVLGGEDPVELPGAQGAVSPLGGWGWRRGAPVLRSGAPMLIPKGLCLPAPSRWGLPSPSWERTLSLYLSLSLPPPPLSPSLTPSHLLGHSFPLPHPSAAEMILPRPPAGQNCEAQHKCLSTEASDERRFSWCPWCSGTGSIKAEEAWDQLRPRKPRPLALAQRREGWLPL